MKQLTVLMLVLIALSAHAGDDITQSNDMNNQTAGNIAGDRSKAFAVGGADYDLASGTCRVHQGGFTIAIATFDEFCQGMALIDRGMVVAGIRHICKQSPIGENYDNYRDCESDLQDMMVTQAPPPPEPESSDDEDEHRELLAQQQRDYEILMERLSDIEAKSRQPAVHREVIQQPWLTAEKRKALSEVVK